MIKFSVPGYIEHEIIIKYFLKLQTEYREYFFENRIIDSAYGMPSNMIWNGGRICLNSSIYGQYIYDLVDSYHDIDFKLRHTCTNMLLNEQHFHDWTCNQYIKYCEKENDSIIVHSEQFANFIKNLYPKYNIIWSTTRRDTNIDVINTLSKSDLLVLDYKYNHNYEILNLLQNPQNIEILCGEDCVFDCDIRTQHYINTSAYQLMIPHTEFQYSCNCNKERPTNFYNDIQTRPHAILNRDIDYLYSHYGICNFKLSGRNAYAHIIIEMILYYLIKPEYRDSIRQEILHIVYEQNL